MSVMATDVRPFHVDVPEEQLDDLRRRIAATRWPTKELVDDRSQGVQLATMQALARYWATEYDWRKCEARLNALPQFTTEIDGVDIHFIHVRSRHENALPLIMTHGWPGSVIELLETIGPLTDPTAHGGSAEDAFHLVLPSLPGYGFSGEPTELGWDAGRTARAWAELMHRLGYTRYVAQGGDVGALVTDLMGRQAVEGLAGYHLNLLTAVLAIGDHLPKESEQERAAAEAVATFRQDGFGYFLEMATRPQTIGYALLDSPVALAAWLLDHDTDSYYKISRAFVDGEPVGNLTRENILDNITLYWLTGTAASAARSYWEDGRALAAALASGQPPPPVSVPVGFTTFPGEIWASPAELGRGGLPRPRLLQRGRQGRPLRRLGGAGALLHRGARRVPLAALAPGRRRSLGSAGRDRCGTSGPLGSGAGCRRVLELRERAPGELQEVRDELDAAGLQLLVRLVDVVGLDRDRRRGATHRRLGLPRGPGPEHQHEVVALDADGQKPRPVGDRVLDPLLDAKDVGVEVERLVLIADEHARIEDLLKHGGSSGGRGVTTPMTRGEDET